MTNDTDEQTYAVVANDEEQYSIWPEDRPLPPGWALAGFRGEKQACLDHIAKVWTDMRPRSVREAIAKQS